jgi:hypothetical protein
VKSIFIPYLNVLKRALRCGHFTMQILTPNQILNFARRFRFQSGTLRSIRLRNRSKRDASAIIVVSILDMESNQRVRLRLHLDGVEEYRFQRRPGPGLVRLKDVRIGFFNGLMYLNLDAYAIDGVPAVHDFRASDAFIAGRALSWEILPPKATSGS